MMPDYIFKITVQGEASHTVHPEWNDQLSLEWKLESQQRFFRSELSGTVNFIREDFQYIMSHSFGTVFVLSILIKEPGSPEQEYWNGSFTHTDCKINIDDQVITVRPKVVDDYTDIMAGLEREFDLIKLAPKIDRIQLCRRPAIQIFDATSETVTCVCGNLSFETDVEMPIEDQQAFIRDHCHFQVLKDEIELDFTDVPFGYEAGFATPFSGEIASGAGTLTNSVGTYFISYAQRKVTGIGVEYYINSLNVYSYAQPSDLKWQFEQSSEDGYLPFPSHMVFVSQHPAAAGNLEADCVDHSLYSRVVCNVSIVNGVRTFDIPTDDLVTFNRNYRKCYPLDVTSLVFQSSRKQSDPTEWGKDANGMYYLPPDDNNQYIPIGRNLWNVTSVWLKVDNSYTTIDSNATALFWLNDAYPLHSCLQRLLAEVAPTVHFGNTSAFSQFLYSGRDPLQGRDNALWLTPKSNITNGEYKTPAQKAPVTLKQIFDMLWNVYKCYWFLERKKINGVMTLCLRIEHVQYFLNGGSYDSPAVDIDLTSLYDMRNLKPWSFCTSTYEYEKTEMPERYQFSWMDEVTELFKGQPVIVVSDFVEKGKIEEVTVNNFTSDLDYMMLNPSGISKDGFALINGFVQQAASEEDEDYVYCPVVTMQMGSNSYRAQNAFLSYHALQWAYWRYDMPARQLNIEGEVNSASRAVTVSKCLKQTVSIPLGLSGTLNLMKLVRTELGNGKVYQATIRLTSRMAKVQLRYDTDLI